MENKNVITTNNRTYVGNVWEKQSWETDKEYTYFLAYLNMAKRSMNDIPDVTSLVNSDGSLNPNPLSGNYMANISVANKWQERTREFDLNNQRELKETLENFKFKGILREIDTFNNLSSMYDKLLKKHSNSAIAPSPKEVSQLTNLGIKIDDYFRRIVGMPEKYTAGTLDTNTTETTVKRIEIVEINRPALTDGNIIEGAFSSSSDLTINDNTVTIDLTSQVDS